jgi:hypothetical protein
MKKPTAAHLKLLQHAKDGDSMFGAAHQMQRTDLAVERLFYEMVDAGMIEHCARDEPMVLTRLGRAVLKGGVGTFKLKKPPGGAAR